jgi:hypothetical protein
MYSANAPNPRVRNSERKPSTRRSRDPSRTSTEVQVQADSRAALARVGNAVDVRHLSKANRAEVPSKTTPQPGQPAPKNERLFSTRVGGKMAVMENEKPPSVVMIGWTCSNGHRNETPRTAEDLEAKEKPPYRCSTPGCATQATLSGASGTHRLDR